MSKLKKIGNWGVGPLKEKDRRTEAEKDRRTEAGEPEHALGPEGPVADIINWSSELKYIINMVRVTVLCLRRC